MEETEDLDKLDSLLKYETSQNDIETAAFIGESSEDEESQDETFSEEVEQDAQEYESQVPFLYRNFDFSNRIKEEELINKCEDVNMKKLMILNRAKYKKLQEFGDKLYKSLYECQRKIAHDECKLQKISRRDYEVRTNHTWKLGIPYFKDTNFFGAPTNIDVQKKKDNGEFSINQLEALKKWSPHDQTVLRRSVSFRYFEYNQQLLEEKIRSLKIQHKAAEGDLKKSLEEDINAGTKQLKQLFEIETYKPPPLGCQVAIDWEKIATEDLNERHTANECFAFWNMYLHPDIYKGRWTIREDRKLKQLVEKYENQNWEKIAEELNTKRSAFTVFLHYHSSLNDKFSKAPFEPEEDRYLLEVIEKCRVGKYIPWNKVSLYFNNRSRTQLYNRYQNFLQKQFKKGVFTETEDVLLMLLVKKFRKTFSQCTKFLENRNVVQLRNRYNCYLHKSVNLNHFTVEEDKELLKLVAEHEFNWALIAKVMNRPPSSVRHRYGAIQKWSRKNPGKDLKDCTSRNHTNQYSKFRKYVVTEKVYKRALKIDHIPTIAEIDRLIEEEKMKRKAPLKTRTGTSTHLDIVDTQLRQFFNTCHKIKPSNRTISQTNVQKSAQAIRTVLELLRATFLKNLKPEMLENPKLDDLDKNILTHIMEEQPPGTSTSNDRSGYVLCPNIHSLIGLRSLLIKQQSLKNQIIKNQHHSDLFEYLNQEVNSNNLVKKSIITDLESMEPWRRRILFKERQSFMQRFYTLFKWPAIMSLLEPKSVLEPIPMNNIPQRVGRPTKSYPKVALMNQARLKMQKMKKNVETVEEEEDGCSSKKQKRKPETCTSPEMSEIEEKKTKRVNKVMRQEVFIKNERDGDNCIVYCKREEPLSEVIQEENCEAQNDENSNGELPCGVFHVDDLKNIQEDIKLLDNIIESEKHS